MSPVHLSWGSGTRPARSKLKVTHPLLALGEAGKGCGVVALGLSPTRDQERRFNPRVILPGSGVSVTLAQATALQV
jgi:hypothetical protein